jgi:hypothetical protein
MGCFSKFLMCVLAPVRIFSVVCFLGVTLNSVCGAVPVRSGLDHLQICAEILKFCDGFKLGIDGLQRVQSARVRSGEQIPAWRASLVTPKSELAPFAECALGQLATAGRRDADARRSVCAPQNFSIIVTKKRSTRFYEIQGPVCVDGLVPRRSFICFLGATENYWVVFGHSLPCAELHRGQL